MPRRLALLMFPVMAVLAGTAVRSSPPAAPTDAWSRTVQRGEALVRHTASLIGPRVADRRLRVSGNALDCQSCHIDGGTKPFGLPLAGAFAAYPSYRPREGQVRTLQDRVNGCLERSLNGRALPTDGATMTAIVAYLKSLSAGAVVGAASPGRGPGPIHELDRAADPQRGKRLFGEQCVMCHGRDGQGNSAANSGLGYAVPPLWGPSSFNDGAGMARLSVAAAFIRNNMPHGTTASSPVSPEADAWDIAAYVESQPRPHKAGLTRDYPDLREKPVDAPYGPYPDRFPARQHRLGPFGPIRAAAAARNGDVPGAGAKDTYRP